MSKKAHSMRINPVVSQYEFERDVRDCLKHGQIKQIAGLVGHSESYVEQQFNPHDDRESVLYRALEYIVAIDMIDRKTGDEVVGVLLRHRTRANESDPLAELRKALEALQGPIETAMAEVREVQ